MELKDAEWGETVYLRFNGAIYSVRERRGNCVMLKRFQDKSDALEAWPKVTRCKLVRFEYYERAAALAGRK